MTLTEIEEEVFAEWDRDADLRAEFEIIERYMSYRVAVASGGRLLCHRREDGRFEYRRLPVAVQLIDHQTLN